MYLETMCSELFERASEVISKRRNSFRGNLSYVCKLAFRWLKENKYVALKTDKDGGFCMCAVQHYKEARLKGHELKGVSQDSCF